MQDDFLQEGKGMKRKLYLGYAKMESADIRWWMLRNNVEKEELASAAGITEKKLNDLLSLRIVPDKEADVLMDAMDKLKKNMQRKRC